MFGLGKFGLGKYRTAFGRWLDKVGMTAVEFAEKSGLHRNTVDSMAGDKGYDPRKSSIDKALKTAKKIDPNVTYEELFPPM